MPNQRSADQEFVGIWVSNALADRINEARGGMPRSQWMRDAIAEKLKRSGMSVDEAEKSAPDRVRYRARCGVRMGDEPNATADSEEKPSSVSKEDILKEVLRLVKRGRSRRQEREQ